MFNFYELFQINFTVCKYWWKLVMYKNCYYYKTAFRCLSSKTLGLNIIWCEPNLLQKAVHRLMRWCHVWHHCAPSSHISLVPSVGIWTRRQFTEGKIYNWHGWRLNLCSLAMSGKKRLMSLHSWKQILDLWMSCIYPPPPSNTSSITGFHHFPAKILFFFDA